MIQRALESLVNLKNRMKKQGEIAAYCDGYDEDADLQERNAELDDIETFDEDADGEPLTWAEKKCIRTEHRRYKTWLALRMKVPRGFEEGT